MAPKLGIRKIEFVFLCITVAFVSVVITAAKPIGEDIVWPRQAIAQISNSNNQNMSGTTPGNSTAAIDGSINNNNIGIGQNITGSIKLRNIVGSAIASQIKISLIEATSIAQKALSGNAHAVAANLGQENGFLVYTIWVVDSNYNFHRIVVDAGNGQILVSQNMADLGRSPLLSPPSGMLSVP
jgi:uncharacterized membrane protein YkoI